MANAGIGAAKVRPRLLLAEGVNLHCRLREAVRRLRSQLAAASPDGFEGILGESASVRALCTLIQRVACTDASVLVVGETGVGKELIARAIHRRSPRSDGPWVAVNCAALPEALLESELFGHTAGAFTGARGARVGLMQQAHGGTLFLDEISEMPLSLQVKLLRALQERTVRPVGGDRELPVDLRLISATNRDLDAAVEEGRFREDLLYRVQVVRVDAPPLRERGNDVLLLGQRFLEDFARRNHKRVVGLSPAFAARILAYDWPGNVRELRNCVERAVALTQHEQLGAEDLPAKIRDFQDVSDLIEVGGDATRFLPLDQIERRYILRVLEAVGGNKARAARILGLNRKTLYRRLDQYAADAAPPRRQPTGSLRPG